MAAEDSGPASQSSLGGLLGGLVSDLSGLFRKEIELAKAEAGERVGEALKAGRNLAMGAVLAIGAVGVLLSALVTGLAAVLIRSGMGEAAAAFVSALLIAIVVGIIAWMMISRGMAEFKANKLNMNRTTHSLRMDAATIRETM